MPADSSCTSSRSTGTFRTSANCATVTSDINLLSTSGASGLEPDFARLHDELAGLFGRQPLDIQQVIDGLVGEILARAYATARQRQCQVRLHALEQQQVIG